MLDVSKNNGFLKDFNKVNDIYELKENQATSGAATVAESGGDSFIKTR
ncbi:MAG: hypothetical protein QOH96_3160 [Blastocatellia bacterium]|jgi:hypothetical protein|nr:hypothetical protein [Blastocatellia bacterium]